MLKLLGGKKLKYLNVHIWTTFIKMTNLLQEYKTKYKSIIKANRAGSILAVELKKKTIFMKK